MGLFGMMYHDAIRTALRAGDERRAKQTVINNRRLAERDRLRRNRRARRAREHEVRAPEREARRIAHPFAGLVTLAAVVVFVLVVLIAAGTGNMILSLTLALAIPLALGIGAGLYMLTHRSTHRPRICAFRFRGIG